MLPSFFGWEPAFSFAFPVARRVLAKALRIICSFVRRACASAIFHSAQRMMVDTDNLGNVGTRRLPAPTQRFVQSNERKGAAPVALGKCILGGIEGTFCIEHGQEALDTFFVEDTSSVGGVRQGGQFCRELVATHLFVRI